MTKIPEYIKVFVHEILTKEELAAAKKLYDTVGIHKFAKACSEQIITPVIDRINKQLGQENDPTYLAYAVEFAFLKGPDYGKSRRKAKNIEPY